MSLSFCPLVFTSAVSSISLIFPEAAQTCSGSQIPVFLNFWTSVKNHNAAFYYAFIMNCMSKSHILKHFSIDAVDDSVVKADSSKRSQAKLHSASRSMRLYIGTALGAPDDSNVPVEFKASWVPRPAQAHGALNNRRRHSLIDLPIRVKPNRRLEHLLVIHEGCVGTCAKQALIIVSELSRSSHRMQMLCKC